MKIATLLPAFSLLLGAAAISAVAAERAPPSRATLAPLAGEVIVRFKADAPLTRRHALAARAEAATVRGVLAQRAGALGQRAGLALEAGTAVGETTQVVRVRGIDAARLAALLRADPDVEFAEPDGRRRISTAPNDPLYAAAAATVRPNGPDAGQWYLRAPTPEVKSSIDIEAAWARTKGSASVVVAVLDTGVVFNHPDLGRAASGGRLLPGYDFVSDSVLANDGNGRDSDPGDPGDWVDRDDRASHPSEFGDCDIAGSSWHGTGTASLVGAATGFGTDKGIGMAGVAPNVKVLPVRVLGKCYGTDSDIQAAMRWAAGISVPGIPNNLNPAKVLNLSLGGGGECTANYQSAVDEVRATGAVVVVAAGNSAGQAIGAPGNCRGVITVVALRHVGTKVGFSDLGSNVSIAAPGGNCVNETGACLYPILVASNDGTTSPGGSAWTSSGADASFGTSFSAPLVAGTAGLMFSVNPTLTPDEIRAALRSSARPFPTTGADNGSGTAPVQSCRQPDGSEQLQCYCTTSTCGAGMLDAGAAVAAAVDVIAPEPEPEPEPASGGGGGGGAMSGGWVLLLASAAAALRRRRR